MILTRSSLAVLLGLFMLSPVQAQHQHQHAPAASPYAGLEKRAVKALSDEQIADLKVGRGMGFALAAELNGYPGPLHVIEFADRLGLTESQRSRMRELHEAMKSETIPLGERLIEEETRLDEEFAGRTITPASLAILTAAIGAAQGELRAAHLKYHLVTLEVLTPPQVRAYGKLRGYGEAGSVHR